MAGRDREFTCERCGGTLSQPEAGAQYECDDCGMVVAPDQVREAKSRGWGT